MDNEENDVLCEKIINEIHGVFIKDNDLASFEIIPTLLNQNKSPVIHVDHNLGLESWCAKHVYDYAHKIIITNKLTNYKNLLQNDSIIKYINISLLINPDVTTFWNIRRQLIEKNKLNIQKEFQFSSIVLTKKPKSSEAFSYRRWLFSFQSGESIDWSFEIGICERCADKSSSNYHAWTHREWVIQKASHFLKTEILLTEKFIKKHISDYSCYHYRQFILKKLYEINYYDMDKNNMNLIYLKELINYYLINGVNTYNEIINTLLPDYYKNNYYIKKNNNILYDENKLKSFLYCCNLAAYDIKFCDELKNIFGYRETFEYHRRSSLKFIVDNCLLLNNYYYYHYYDNDGSISCSSSTNNIDLYYEKNQNLNDKLDKEQKEEQKQQENEQQNQEEEEQQQQEQSQKSTKIKQNKNNEQIKYDYTSNAFLLALKKSEGMLGEKHRKWCKLFLGFDYSNYE